MNDLSQLIKKHCKEKKLNKWDYVFQQWDNNTSLFYILEWDLLLEKDWNIIFSVGKDQILWEKSFIQNTWKPIDARAQSDIIFYELTQNDFQNYSDSEKIEFFSIMSLTLSDRVYNINDILSNINILNNKILKISDDVFEEHWFINLFEGMVDIQSYYLLKHNDGFFQNITSNNILEESVEAFLNDLIEQKHTFKVGQNYIYINANDYIYFLIWEVKIKKYVISNTLFYSIPTFKYLWQLLEDKSCKKIMSTIE